MFLLSEFGERLVRVSSIDGFEFINIRPHKPGITTIEQSMKETELETWVMACIQQRNLPLCKVETKEEAIAVCKELALTVDILKPSGELIIDVGELRDTVRKRLESNPYP